MEFNVGDSVEIERTGAGFKESLWPAKIIRGLEGNRYRVRYTTIWKNDRSGKLEGSVHKNQVRPKPEKVNIKRFKRCQLVDVNANSGWWIGFIEEVNHPNYRVEFSHYPGVFHYNWSKIRLHLEWDKEDDSWTFST
jgi:hypothetical protein